MVIHYRRGADLDLHRHYSICCLQSSTAVLCWLSILLPVCVAVRRYACDWSAMPGDPSLVVEVDPRSVCRWTLGESVLLADVRYLWMRIAVRR